MPRKRTRRLDRFEHRGTRADHWGLFGLLGSVCRALEAQQLHKAEQGPHTPARTSVPVQVPLKAGDEPADA